MNDAHARNSQLVTAVEVARRFHLSYQTVNYYTNLGLLIAARKRGNHRLYRTRDTADRLRRIESLKHEGFPLKLIGRFLESPRGHIPLSWERRSAR